MKKRILYFATLLTFMASMFIFVYVSHYSNTILSVDIETLTNSESPIERQHQTVVSCGGEHPRYWKTGCCEGSGTCTSQCDLDYPC